MCPALMFGRKFHIIAILLAEEFLPRGKSLEIMTFEWKGDIIFEKSAREHLYKTIVTHRHRTGRLTSLKRIAPHFGIHFLKPIFGTPDMCTQFSRKSLVKIE